MTVLKPCRYSVAALLPQAPPMLLLDEILGWNAECLVALVTVRPDALFLDAGQMPPHVAIEWMAQTCGAMVGVLALERGEAVRIGFLLGTRDFKARVSGFSLGDKVTVTVGPVLIDGEMAVFDCRVEREDEICATARLNLFQPDSLQSMLEAQGLAAGQE